MFESYDVKTRNPYDAPLGTRRPSPGGTFKAASIALPAGHQLAGHTMPSSALPFMLEGRASLATCGEQIDRTPGSVAHIPPRVAQRIDAVGDGHFVLVR